MRNKAGLFRAEAEIILASGSPRRREMLAELGIAFTVKTADVEEPAPDPGEGSAGYAMRMATIKGRPVAEKCSKAIVIAADTVVALPDAILGKPGDEAHALKMLTDLTGANPGETTTHEVVTGVYVADTRNKTGKEQAFAAHTAVTMGHHSQEVLKSYIQTGEPMDKAGSYGIQGIGSFLVTHVEGSYTNVVGLPLARVLEVLVSWGVIVPRQG